MLIWIAALAALGLAFSCILYSFLRLKPTLVALRNEQARLTSEIDLVASSGLEVAGNDEPWRNDERRLSRMLDQQQTALGSTDADLAAMKSEMTDLKTQISARLGDGGAALARLNSIENDLAKYPTANAPKALSHSRRLSDEAADRLISELCPALAVELKERHLFHMAHRVCVLENQCHGRLATSIDTIITRMIAAMHLTQTSGKTFCCTEIGTLYGIGAIAVHDIVRFGVDDLKLVLIDPLDGYYGEAERDFSSIKPVSRDVLTENLATANIPDSDILILQEKSQSKKALDAMADQSIDLLIIDGDHSKAGVKRDFDNYFPLVRPGGIIVIDDYGVKEWPDIKAYADEKVLPRTDVQTVFTGFRTLLLRKI